MYFLTRQTIFNTHLEVIGYEVRFEKGFEGVLASQSTTVDKPEEAISKLFFSVGIEDEETQKIAFVPFTPKLLTERVASLFSSGLLGIIFNIPQSPDKHLFDECLRLKRQGYTIILDKFVPGITDMRFLEAGSLLRLDTQYAEKLTDQQLTPILEKGVELLAGRVSEKDTISQLRRIGFRYFQGDFFSKPQPVPGKEIPPFKVAYLQLMREVLQPDIEFKKIEEIVIKDVSLSYKLLKMVNTAAFGFRKEITSIRQALVIIGAKEIKKWVSLVSVNNIGDDKSDELFKKALFRARFCELVAPSVDLAAKSSDLFLMGMFSLIDAFVDRPLNEIINGLPLSADIKQALSNQTGPYAPVISLVKHYENGNWKHLFSTAATLNIDENALPEIYFSAMEWVLQIFE